ncbi:hypothetical protein [Rhizobium ruizarguesonis]|uniref:hypothetical protein n=1 Tax=Rhizobium ruizarguesonis TaxID=2081791 RepID=UPI0010326010|nr:hypothetical protein [Rhizobium ruizarguesonis]TAZ57815.1 hypothetical protein ELH71_16180 [Rhizobium ruizarguesonis]
MFTRKTVFVVGAGASKEAGLPVGEELKTIIANKLDIKFQDGYDQKTGDRGIVNALRLISEERGERNINPFLHAGHTISAAMPQAISIDNFLHTHAADEKMVLMGKLAIAASILEAEKKSKLVIDNNSQTINFNAHHDIWHNTFCKMLCEGVQLADLDVVFDNVGFVTFNYDRCIEHYVAHWLANYMLISIDQAQSLTSKLKVFHPYGQVGRLPWQKSGRASIQFGAGADAHSLPKIADQIRTFTEQVEDDEMLQAMRDLLAQAEQVIYIGFSYGRMNMQLMQLTERLKDRDVLGTVCGMSVANGKAAAARIRDSFRETNDGPDGVGECILLDTTANRLLNDYWSYLSD